MAPTMRVRGSPRRRNANTSAPMTATALIVCCTSSSTSLRNEPRRGRVGHRQDGAARRL